MKNKIEFLIVIDWLVTPLMEIGAEICFEKAFDGKKVMILIVDDYIKSEGFNSRLPNILRQYDIPKKIEKIIRSKKNKNIKISVIKIKKDIDIKLWPKEIISAFLKIQENEFDPINKNLKDLYLNNINIGEGILSSIISSTKKTSPTFFKDKKIIKEVFNLFMRRYLMYCSSFKKELKIENLIIFNGRFASSKAIESSIFKYKKNTKIFYYERSHTLHRYTLSKYKVHDRKKIVNEINALWGKNNNIKEASKIAQTYFKMKISGRGTDWFPFSKGIQDNSDNQISNILNQYSSKGAKKAISYFSSSEDEFESLGDVWLDRRFKFTQEEIIKELSKIAVKKNIILIIRLHPNLDNASYESKFKWTNILSDLPKKNTLIIRENDNISSYKVIKISKIVVVYGSTVGIEALFLKKPVIVTGPSFYLGTKAKVVPAFSIKDLENIIENLLANYDLDDEYKNQLKESTYPFGYWAFTHGLEYKSFMPSSPIKGYLFKYDLQKLHRILSKFKKILKRFFIFQSK